MTSPSARDWPPSVLVAARLFSVAVILAALYWLQAVFVPLVMAVLLTFLFSPFVTRLDRLRVPRIVGVLLVMTLVGGLVGGIGYVVVGQVRSFAEELPTHRQNIRARIREVVAFTQGSTLENVQQTIEDINQVVEEEGAPPASEGRARDDEPARVALEPPRPLLDNAEWLGPLFGAAGTIGLTLLLVIFMLVGREDLRDRLVSLTGRPSLVVATKALADAGERMSRYLLMQFVVNASMGLAVGAGLYLIGVPYAALWGLVAGVLRYVPYIGPWIAAVLPVTVSVVTVPGWEQVAMVVALFVVLELLSNNVMEPLLYGQSVGLSPFAVIVAAIFWAWLWGPVGLVIATPITACLVVFSSYVPALGPLGRLLGPRPALRPHHTLYQRLLAQDVDEADAIVTRYRSERSLDEALQLLLDTLLALKRDLQAARISAEDGEHVVTGLRDLIDALRPVDDARAEKPVLLVGAPGRDPLDAVVLELARVLLRDEPLKLEVLSTNLMTGEMLAEIDAKAPAAVLVPSLPPGGLTPTRQLCLRVHARLPQLPLVAARLGDPEGEVSDRVSMLEKAGCTDVAASLAALKSTVQRIARASVRDVSSAGPALVAAG